VTVGAVFIGDLTAILSRFYLVAGAALHFTLCQFGFAFFFRPRPYSVAYFLGRIAVMNFEVLS
jgi:hypothetical protein